MVADTNACWRWAITIHRPCKLPVHNDVGILPAGAERAVKFILRVWTSSLEFDAIVLGTLGGKRIGSGMSLGECARDIDLEFETETERDAACAKAITVGFIRKTERR